MKDLETQVGQIYISDKKLSKSFISLYSEKFESAGSEGYFLMEIPILNPAIWSEYERMASRLQASFQRNLRKSNPNSFENAIAQINDDLSAIASEGQTSWVGKLGACIAAKQGDTIFVATTGKVNAYLYRDDQLSNIADTEPSASPLKTFANFAQGKIREKDVLIFSTPQLFNYLSVERLKNLLSRKSISDSTAEIGDIIKNNADENISFATFVLKLSPAGSGETRIVNLGEVISGENSVANKMKVPFAAIKNFLANLLLLSKKARLPEVKKPNISVPKVNFKELWPSLKIFFSIQKFKALPRAKKFFLIAATVFILALLVDLGVVIHSRAETKRIAGLNAKLTDIENKINNANASFIIHDESKALSALNEAASELNSVPEENAIRERRQQVAGDLEDIQNTIGHIQKIDPTEIANYTSATIDDIELIKDQLFLINRKGSLLAPVSITKKTVGKDMTLSIPSLRNSATVDGLLFLEDEQGDVYQVSTDLKTAAKQAVKLPNDSKGFEVYGSPEKAYTVSARDNQVVFGTVKTGGTTQYIKDGTGVSNAIDMAIDGSVYVLTSDDILKFTKGTKQTFSYLGMKFSDSARIKAGAKNLYIMDPGAKKIIVRNKSGQIVNQFISDKFDNLKDIAVDEANHALYIVNGSRLYSIRIQ